MIGGDDHRQPDTDYPRQYAPYQHDDRPLDERRSSSLGTAVAARHPEDGRYVCQRIGIGLTVNQVDVFAVRTRKVVHYLAVLSNVLREVVSWVGEFTP